MLFVDTTLRHMMPLSDKCLRNTYDNKQLHCLLVNRRVCIILFLRSVLLMMHKMNVVLSHNEIHTRHTSSLLLQPLHLHYLISFSQKKKNGAASPLRSFCPCKIIRTAPIKNPKHSTNLPLLTAIYSLKPSF